MKHTILRSVWAAALVAVAVVNSPPSVQAQSDPPPGMTLVTTGVPTFGSFFSLSGNPALLPMPFDVMPWLPLYVSDSDASIYYIDDRGLDETLADVNSLFAIISSPPGSGVMVRGGGVHADDDGPPVPEGDEGGGGSGSGGPAQGGIAPPGAGYINCLSYTNFWLISAPGSASNVVSITISNTLSGLSYLLLAKGDLGQSAWFANTPLTASGPTVSTNINIGINQYMFFNAMLATNDQPPVIVTGPTNQVVNSGGTATFYVTATGLEPLSYFWYLNGTNISGANTNSLTVSGVTSANAGIYTVVVSNAICEDSASAGLGFTWTNNLSNAVWTSPNAVNASPAVSQTGIFVPDEHGNLWCLDPVTGNIRWMTNLSPYAYIHTTASPALAADGSAVYVRTQEGPDGMEGAFYAINPTNGAILWSNHLGGGVSSSPAVASDGTIYAPTFGTTNALFALNPTNGSVKWVFQASDSQAPGAGWDSSPAIENDGSILLLNISGSELYSVWPDGHLRWFFPIPSGNSPSPSPALDGTGNIFIGDSLGYVYCLTPWGALKWIYDTGTDNPIQSSIAVDESGVVYAASLVAGVYAITNGNLAWEYPGDGFLSSGAVTSDHAVVIGDGGNIYALTNGVGKWTNSAGAISASAAFSPVDGGAIIASEEGRVYKLPGTPSPVDGSPWPMFRQNASRTGAFPGESGSGPGVATAFPNFASFNGADEFDFYVSGKTNSLWSVYASTNLVNWTLLTTNLTLNAEGYTGYGETGISLFPRRYYQVASSNFCSPIIGFINQTYSVGTNLISNPFTQANYADQSPVNTAQGWWNFLGQNSSYLTNPLPNCEIINGAGVVDAYSVDIGFWSPNGDLALAPGQSFFFVNQGTNPVTLPFAGVLPYGSVTNLITPGTNFVSSTVPVAGLVQTDLGLTPHNGDDVLTWSGSQFLTHYYNNGWTNQPSIGIGEGFVIVTSQSNAWATNFVPCQH